MNRKYLWLLIFVFLLALIIRFYHPTFRSLWGDEAHSAYNAYSLLLGNLIKDSHLPIYFILLSMWIKLFGSGEYALRLLSIFIGILSVLTLYFFAKKLFNGKIALMGAFLLAISPLAVMHSQEIRMYGLMLFLSLLSSLCFWELLCGRKSFLNLMGYVIFTVLLALTHIYASLLLAAQFLFVLFDYWKEKDLRRFGLILLLQTLTGILISPVYVKIVSANLAAAVTGTADMAFSVFPWHLKLFLVFFVLSLGETVAPWNIAVALPAGLIFGYLFFRNFRWASDKKIAFFLIMCLFPILFSVIFLKPTMPKYLMVVLPFYLLLVGHSLMLVEGRYLRYFLISGIVVIQFFSIVNYFSLREYHNSNQIEPWRKVAALISEKFKKGDIIIASKYFTSYRLLNYYLNLLWGKDYPIFCLQKENYDPGSAKKGYYPLFNLKGEEKDVKNIANPRIWFVTHILDDHTFPPGYVERYRLKIEPKYKLVMDKNYVPYEETLVSRLPIKRHQPGSSRIKISLYVRK